MIHSKKIKICSKNGKYLILLFLVMSAIIGSSFLHFFDHLVIFERSLTLIFYPIVTYLIGLFTLISYAVSTETVIALIYFFFNVSLYFLHKKIFARVLGSFFTTKQSGTGHGLAIAKEIVDKHNRMIEIESGEGKDTTAVYISRGEEKNDRSNETS